MACLCDAETLFVTTVLTGPLAICVALEVVRVPAPEGAQLVLEPMEAFEIPAPAVRRIELPERAQGSDPRPERGPELALVVDALGPHVVLAVDPAGDLEHGPARWVHPDVRGDTVASLSRGAWPDPAGAGIVLYGPEGEACRGELAAPVLLSRLEYLEVDMFLDPEEYASYEQEDGSLVVPAERELQLAWENGDRIVAAPLVDVDGDCTGALWARGADRPGPRLLTRGGHDRETARAFRRSPAFADLRREWDEFGGDAESGGTFRDQVSKHVLATRWNDSAGETVRTTVEIPTGMGGCGEFEADAWGVMRGGTILSSRESVSPVAVFDADRDGRFELVVVATGSNLHTDVGLLRETADGFEWLTHATRSLHGCPC